MKKIFSFFAAVLLAFAANAATINIDNTTPDALRLALNNANNFDEIVMAAGTYVESNSNYIAIDGKEVFVKAAEGAEVIIQPQVPITISNGGVATFENVKIDASRLTELADWYEHLIYAADDKINGLKLKGCEIYGFALNNSMIYCSSTNKFAGITIDDCYFHDIEKSVLFIENTAKTMSAQIKNSTFENIIAKVTGSYYAGIIDIRATEALITFDKCTFYNVIPMNTDFSAVSKVTLTNGTVSNCIFMLPTAQDGIRAMRGVAATNCITYNYLKDSGTGIHSSVTQTNCVQVDPLFKDAANGDFTLGAGSPALTMNDGQPIGDPRWWPAAVLEPATFYGATSFITEGAVIDPAVWTAVEYNITRKADKTLAFELTWTGDVVGMVPQLKIGEGGFTNMVAEGKKATLNPDATYEDGATVNVEFYLAYAGAAKSIPVSYTVGATNEKPATPVDVRMSGAYKVGGEAPDFASLYDACAALETNGMKGDVQLIISGDLAENKNVGITNNTNYTLSIVPDGATKRTIQYGEQADNAGPSGHIIIGEKMALGWSDAVATKNVVIDGSFEGEGQYLEFRGGKVGGVVIVLYGGLTNTVVKNCRIINPRTSGTTYAVQFRSEKDADNAPQGVGLENCYLEVTSVANAQVVYYNGSQSASAAGKPKDCYLRGCEIVSNLRGVFFNGATNAVFEGNTFRFPAASGGYVAHGIMGNVQSGNIIVRNNKFIEMKTTNVNAGEFGMCGITASGGSDVWVIENNYFAGLDATGAVAGKAITLRYVRCGDSCVVRHNTFYVPALTNKPATDLVAASPICALYLAGAKAYPVENNIFVSEEAEANNSLIRGAVNENVKNNVFFHKGGNAAVLAGAVVAKTWEEFTAEGANAGSKWAEPKFADAANGDLAITEKNEALKVARLETVLKDIDGKDRAEQTYAGAFEFVEPGGTDAVDNIELREGAQKIFRNGQVLIIRDGKAYNMMGQIVR